MIKNNVTIKDKLTENEAINFTKDYADAFFNENEIGEIEYTPYLKDLQFKMLFYLYCVDGLEFEYSTDESGNSIMENIIDAVDNDEEVSDLFTRYLKGAYKGSILSYQLGRIKKDALDMVEFKKQSIIHYHEDAFSNLLNTIALKISEIDLSNIDMQSITDYIMNAYLKSDVFKDNQKEIKKTHDARNLRIYNTTKGKTHES